MYLHSKESIYICTRLGMEWNDTVIGQVVMTSVALPIDTPPGVVHSG